MKKRLILILSLLVFGAPALLAQEQVTEVAAPVDSTLLGRSILSVLGPGVTIHQSAPVQQALDEYVKANAQKQITGFRIRVFYDNGPQARVRSENIQNILSRR